MQLCKPVRAHADLELQRAPIQHSRDVACDGDIQPVVLERRLRTLQIQVRALAEQAPAPAHRTHVGKRNIGQHDGELGQAARAQVDHDIDPRPIRDGANRSRYAARQSLRSELDIEIEQIELVATARQAGVGPYRSDVRQRHRKRIDVRGQVRERRGPGRNLQLDARLAQHLGDGARRRHAEFVTTERDVDVAQGDATAHAADASTGTHRSERRQHQIPESQPGRHARQVVDAR